MAGPCHDCDDYAERFCCMDCYREAPIGATTAYRCPSCRDKHAQAAHGKEPVSEVCAGCKKDLGPASQIRRGDPRHYSPVGAPWCGTCPTWWH